jgi:hypothetical protein
VQYGGDAASAALGLSGNASADSDLNGDGIKDLVVGGSEYAGATEKGRIYVIYGGEFQNLIGTEITLTDSNYTSELFAEGVNANDKLANNVVSGGDITGDGIDDVVVAASGYSSGNGISYVIAGAPTDWDADGHASVVDNDADGFFETTGDCNDKQATIYAGATETANGFDDDCDGAIDEDTTASDDDGDGMTEDAGDCNDANAAVYLGAPELADAIDNDCDSVADDGLTDVTITNKPANVTRGVAATVKYRLTNNSGLQSFTTKIWIDKALYTGVYPTNTCTTAICKSLKVTNLAVAPGLAPLKTASITVPAGFAIGTHVLRIELFDRVSGALLDTDVNQTVIVH